MTGGTEFLEIQESIKETPEVAEVKQTLDRAAFEPEATVEQTVDIKVSEAVQEAFMAAVSSEQTSPQASEQFQTAAAVLDIEVEQPIEPIPAGSDQNSSAGDSGGKADFGSESSNPADHYSGVNLAQGEVGETVLDETSFKFGTPPPEQQTREGIEAEISEEILDESSFKFGTPPPDQETGGVIEIEQEIMDEASYKVEAPFPEEDSRGEARGDESQGEVLAEEEDREILDENAFKPVPAQEGEAEIIDVELEMGETDLDLDSPEPALAEDVGEEGETTEDLKDANETGPDWYIHEDSEGNKTIVDIDGNPVNSPPVLYHINGKTYASYPGDKPAIDEKGSIKDPSKLIELPNYQTDVKEIYLHEHSDGSVTAVDKYGKPFPSQPSVITFQGKKYIGYPGQDLGFDEQGNITNLKALEDHEAKYFQQSTEGMYLHDDGKGNITVVDEEGKPVLSQPTIITYEGKNYIVYPGQDLGIDAKGAVTDPKALKAHEASYFQQSTEGMYLHDDGKGNITVVDGEGKPVPSQPTIVTYKGKNYIVYPGQDLGIDAKGTVTDPNVMALENHEAKYYQQSTEGMYLHDDGKGNITVVDMEGKSVPSQPTIVTYEGKNYIVYPGQDLGIDAKGAVTDPKALEAHETSYFQQSTEGMYLHDDGKGNFTVVDAEGKPVDSPPIIVEKDGKMYATYPGWDDGIDNEGKITNQKLFDQREISFYTPPWWVKTGKVNIK